MHQLSSILKTSTRRLRTHAARCVTIVALLCHGGRSLAEDAYAAQIRPLVEQYCFRCHSTEKHKGSLDLQRFTSLAQLRKDVKPWQATIEMLEAGEMPPKDKPQPTAEQRQRMIAWVSEFLDSEARAR